jgi:hypothetical protein
MRDAAAQEERGTCRVTATGNKIEAPEALPRRKTRWKAHVRGLFVLAVMIAALTGAFVFVVFVRIG